MYKVSAKLVWPGLDATANVDLSRCVRVLDGARSYLVAGPVRIKLEQFYSYIVECFSDKLDQYGLGRSGAGRSGLISLQYLSTSQENTGEVDRTT